MVAIVHSSDLALLRNPRADSTYAHVYPHRRRWKAIAFKHRIRLGTYDTPREAAAAVVAWWMTVYGEHWRAAYEAHRRPAWAISRRPGEGYRLTVWEFGRKRTVPPPNPKAEWFWSKGEALDYFLRWRRERFGLWDKQYWLFLRRGGGSEYEYCFRGRHAARPKSKPRPKVAPNQMTIPFEGV